nr:caspase family protein [Calditrichia bacterium]
MDMEQTRLNFANSWAFIVGINDYANIPSLKTAVNDAERIAEVLTESHHFQLGALLKNPGKSDLMTLLEETLPATVKKEDRVFVYFAGHGIAADGDEGPTGQLVPADANPDDIHSFVPMDLLNRKLNDLPCRHLLLVLDCCFSGAFKWSTTHRAVGRLVPKKLYAERFDRFLVDPAWQVITSAAYDQKALDFLSNKDADVRGAVVSDDDGRQHSPFAKALIDGLDGAADARVEHDQEGDGVITATELYSYIRNSVEPRTIAEDEKMRQTPGFFPLANHNKGEFIFLHPRHRLNLPPRPRRSPYPGARSFSLGDRELFYGREKASQDLFNKVISAPMTVVSGPSGSGKSSLVFAGLSPRLAEALWKILPPLRVNRDPVAGLNAVFNQLRIWEITDGGAEKLAGLGLPARFTEKLKTMKGQRYLGADYMLSVFRHISGYHATFGSWEEHLLHEIESKPFLETPLGPAEGIPPRLINALKQDRYVLQADQWDNLYSDCEDEDLRRRFQENLVTLLEEAGPEHFRLVLTVGDARKSLLKEGPLAPFLKGAEFPVPPMTLEEMKEAVVMPTVQEVLIFDPPELVDQLVQEVYRSPGALPLLSVTLADLYGEYEQSGREDRALTGRDYLAMGGVSGMVRQRARNIYEKALQQSFRLTPEVLERLVAAGLHPASAQSLEKLLYEEYINRRKFLEAVARHAGFVLSARDSAAIDADLSEAEKMQIAEVNDRFFPNREALVKALEAAHARPFAPARLEAIVAVADQAGRFSDTILEEATGSLDGYYVINGSVFKILESQGVESHILGALDDLRNVLFESRVEFRKALERPLAPYYPGPAGPAAQDAM